MRRGALGRKSVVEATAEGVVGPVGSSSVAVLAELGAVDARRSPDKRTEVAVVDAAVDGCPPDPSVGVTLCWTGALEAQATQGWDRGEADWTCEGGRTLGIEAYEGARHPRAGQSVRGARVVRRSPRGFGLALSLEL